MDLIKKYYSPLGLVLLLIIFVWCKLPVLHTGYFWDELGVYAPGALKMRDNGTISLMPAALEPFYSRGHPLLCYFCYAFVYNIFGPTVAVGHSLSILLGCVTLVAFFWWLATSLASLPH